MPSLYAHYTFGQRVRKLLPEEIQICINRYEDLFNLGLQGPDHLFFYRPLKANPINQMGHRLHKKPAIFYFQKMIPIARKKGPYCAECAYLLGFLCHFMLDSAVHPYVNAKIEETGIRHVDMEGEFEKYLMYRDWVRPEKYPVWKNVPVSLSVLRTMGVMYPWIPPYYVGASVVYFRFCKWLLTAQYLAKKRFLIWGMKKTGYYEKLRGHYIWDDVKEEAIPLSEGFITIFEEQINKTAMMEQWLFQTIGSKKRITYPSRLRQNFDGVIK